MRIWNDLTPDLLRKVFKAMQKHGFTLLALTIDGRDQLARIITSMDSLQEYIHRQARLTPYPLWVELRAVKPAYLTGTGAAEYVLMVRLEAAGVAA